MPDVSVGFRPPCWCPSGEAPTWLIHTNLFKFWAKAFPHILQKKNCYDLNLSESLSIVTFFSQILEVNLFNGFNFLFDLF